MISNLEKLTPDEMFELHAELTAVLAEKLKAKTADLDAKLRQLQPLGDPITPARRAYPPVKAKFRNPDRPTETWSGRGMISGLRARIARGLCRSNQLAKPSKFRHLTGKRGNALRQLPLEIHAPL
jgi:hypothetical protein